MLSKKEVCKRVYGIESPIEYLPVCNADADRPDPPFEKWVKMEFPYQAPVLPAPLPTIEDIRRAGQMGRIVSHRCALNYVFRVSAEYIVKFSPGIVILQEAENLLFLQQHSRVRTPKVYAAFSHKGGNPLSNPMCELVEYHYLVMEFIEGGSLSHNRWLALDQKDQEKVTLRIAEQIQLLRSVPSEGYYGRIMHQGWEPEFSLFRIRMADMCGPYSTYEDCIMALYATAEARAAVSTMAPDFYPDQLLALTNLKHTLTNCAGHEPTLTHLDLKLENIMVRPIQGAKGKVEDYEVVLIDWACLGWLPAWMEAVTVLQRPIFRSQLDTDAFIWGLSQGIKPFHIGVASFFNSLADSVVYHIQ